MKQSNASLTPNELKARKLAKKEAKQLNNTYKGQAGSDKKEAKQNDLEKAQTGSAFMLHLVPYTLFVLTLLATLLVIPLFLLPTTFAGTFFTFLIPVFHFVLLPSLSKDRFSVLRTSRFRLVRTFFQYTQLLHLAYRIVILSSSLPAPSLQHSKLPNSRPLIDGILQAGPDTYQKKETNVLQIQSLLSLVTAQIASHPILTVLDIGAGKALFTRAVYEALSRRVVCIAFDSRKGSKKDEFYDPPDPARGEEEPYVRVVADVKNLTKAVVPHFKPGGQVLCITKHLCGSATDLSLMSMLKPSLGNAVTAVLLVPCCHQKTLREQYCNLEWLQSKGFCTGHVGLRGGKQDMDWTAFSKLISISKMIKKDSLKPFEYSKSPMLKLLGFGICKKLGRRVRLILEEGRRRRLVEGGFEDARIVEYIDGQVTGDNLCIIGAREGESLICTECN